MGRLNVRESQLAACIESSMFAMKQRQSIEPGELLLLQLSKPWPMFAVCTMSTATT